jgi:DNA (cytosine-5)-methyltransferase 1
MSNPTTVSALRAECKAKGIKGCSKKTKAELLELLKTLPPTLEEPVQEQSYKVLSLFTGMCGMDCGFAEDILVQKESVEEDWIASQQENNFVSLKRLPFSIVFQNDILKEAKRIAELNHWAHNYHLKDIRDMLKENFVFPEAHVVIGGFPCQDFSHAGKRKGFDSSRGTLYQSFVEVVKRVRPYLFVAENVNGLLTMPGNPIEKIVADFSAVGYEVKYELIKCEEYGIPQTRWRVILMGVRTDCSSSLPPTWNSLTESKRIVSVKPYLVHLKEPTQSTDPAQQVYSKAAKLVKGQGQKEIVLTACAPTIRAEHHGNIEFRRVTGGVNKEPTLPERRLTVREAALLQTFPPNCILTEPKKKTTTAYKPIGNAVPPLLGYLIARKVRHLLDTISSNTYIL